MSPKGRWELLKLQCRGDDRGNLGVAESMRDVPFDIKRVYYLVGTQPGVRRGLHAHRKLDQILIAVSGSVCVTVDNGSQREKIILNDPFRGLRITDLVWREMEDFSPDCVLVVLASAYYQESDYIREYSVFKTECLK